MPELFSCVDVRKVDFDGRDAHCRNRIPQRNASMGISSRIEDNNIKLPFSLLNPSDKLAFKIGLPEIDFSPSLARPSAYHRLDVGQRCPAINLRFPLAKQVQDGTVQDKDSH